jgi:7,8-dihydropterin-6-yl-methyl-4-(beta-D-ribofuranosyl)aminobenzene 5'-phosphate synthase
MKLTVLTENVAGGKLSAEHGLSYLIETANGKCLFDTGHSDLFLQNAKRLKINSDEIKYVVLSHGHWDHGNGLEYLSNKILITHPASFMKRYRVKDNSYLGLSNTRFDLMNRGFEIIETKKTYEVFSGLFFLGEIPRLNSFEAKTTAFIDENGKPDFIPDDSAIVVIENNELIVITGCSHSGICNIIEHAKEETGINKVRSVIGGFHLKNIDEQTLKTIEYFKENKIENIYPSHCTELPALSAFYNKFNIQQVKTGMQIEL